MHRNSYISSYAHTPPMCIVQLSQRSVLSCVRHFSIRPFPSLPHVFFLSDPTWRSHLNQLHANAHCLVVKDVLLERLLAQAESGAHERRELALALQEARASARCGEEERRELAQALEVGLSITMLYQGLSITVLYQGWPPATPTIATGSLHS